MFRLRRLRREQLELAEKLIKADEKYINSLKALIEALEYQAEIQDKLIAAQKRGTELKEQQLANLQSRTAEFLDRWE